MGSPVVQDDFPALSSTADVCTRLSQLLTLWSRFGDFLGWLLDSDGNISDAALETAADRTMPIGAILMYASHTPPSSKWMTCTGQTVSRATYSDLFSRIGTTYGNGDGATTFNLPDLRNRVPIGAGSNYNPGSTGGATSQTLNLRHSHGIAKSSGNDNINFPTSNWSIPDNGTGPTIGISGDDVDDADTAAITTGDISSTTESPDLRAVSVPTLPPYCGVSFMIKVL